MKRYCKKEDWDQTIKELERLENEQKYKKLYFDLIEKYQGMDLSGEYHAHHIIPRSICPMMIKVKSNLVNLPYKDHYMAHYYLWQYFKYLGEKKWANKMRCALVMMGKFCIKATSEKAAKKISEVYHLACIEHKKEMTGKPQSEQSKKKNRQAKKDKMISVQQIDNDGNIVQIFQCLRDAERYTGINHSSIKRSCKKTYMRAGGFFWKFVGKGE